MAHVTVRAGRPRWRDNGAECPAVPFVDAGVWWRKAMDSIWMALFWTGPIGVGFFLMGLGVLFWGIGQMSKK